MRIKLFLDDLPTSQNRKVCFLVNSDSCKKVTDLCYLIKKRFYNGNGSVNLYLDGFYIPPNEDVLIIQENDVLKVKFVTAGNLDDTTADSLAKATRKRKASTSSSSSSSSDEEITKQKKKIKDEKTSTKILPQKQSTVKKKVPKILPLSQLGISKKKKVSTSSSSSSSSSDSSSEEDETINKKKTKGNTQKVPPPRKEQFKQPLPPVSKIVVKKKKKDSSSSSSSNSSSSDEDEISITKSLSKVDFNVSNLPTSTPFPTPPSILTKSHTKSLNSSLNKTNSAKKNQNMKKDNAKAIAAKDVYANLSQLFMDKKPVENKEELKKNDDIAVDEKEPTKNADSSIPACANGTVNTNDAEQSVVEVASLNDTNGIGNDDAVDDDIGDLEQPPSGKTLRNRRRRQKKLQIVRNKKEEEKKKKEENKKNEINNKEPAVETVENNEAVKEQNNNDNNDNKSVPQETEEEKETSQDADVKNQVEVRDYSTYPSLTEPPKEGNVIAYKILEMSQSYTPEMSAYKEAIVNKFDELSKQLELQLSYASLRKVRGDGNITNRFELPKDQEEGEQQICQNDLEKGTSQDVDVKNQVHFVPDA